MNNEERAKQLADDFTKSAEAARELAAQKRAEADGLLKEAEMVEAKAQDYLVKANSARALYLDALDNAKKLGDWKRELDEQAKDIENKLNELAPTEEVKEEKTVEEPAQTIESLETPEEVAKILEVEIPEETMEQEESKLKMSEDIKEYFKGLSGNNWAEVPSPEEAYSDGVKRTKMTPDALSEVNKKTVKEMLVELGIDNNTNESLELTPAGDLPEIKPIGKEVTNVTDLGETPEWMAKAPVDIEPIEEIKPMTMTK